MAQPLLEVKHLKTQFRTKRGTVTAVDDVSFSVNQGDTLGIVGESGCGKSVTSLSILQLLPHAVGSVAGGEILYKGEDIAKKGNKEMCRIRGREISMIFQDSMTSLNPVLTIGRQLEETISVHSSLSKDEIKKQALDILTKVGVSSPEQRLKEFPHQLSGGMRQRVMIAMALSCSPSLLIADEPTTALDVTIQDQIMKLLNLLKQELGMSIILVTHDLGVIAQMCDRVAVMYAGQIVEMTDTVTLFSRPRHPYTYGLMGSLPNEETAGTTLEAIKGSPPNLAHLPEGCPFSPRCKYACDLCRRERPALTEVEPGHLARCHRLDVTASFQGLIEVPDGAGRKEDTPHG